MFGHLGEVFHMHIKMIYNADKRLLEIPSVDREFWNENAIFKYFWNGFM